MSASVDDASAAVTTEGQAYFSLLPRIYESLDALLGHEDGAVAITPEDFRATPEHAAFRALPFDYAGTTVMIIGHDGIGGVLAHEIAAAGARAVHVVAESDAAETLADELGRAHPDVEVRRMTQAELAAGAAGLYRPDHIINGTKIGEWPATAAMPIPAPVLDQLLAKHPIGVLDNIANPTATRLILRAKSFGVESYGGLAMLFNHAVSAWRDRLPKIVEAADEHDLEALQPTLGLELLRQHPIKWILTGFMGSGKTTIGRVLGEQLGDFMPVCDMDEEIVNREGASIPTIFAERGEVGFRQAERDLLIDLLDRPGPMLISSGGGTMVQPGAAELAREKGAFIIGLDVCAETALERVGADPNRPMLRDREKDIELFTRRQPLYQNAADLLVDANQSTHEVCQTILQAFALGNVSLDAIELATEQSAS